MQTQLFKLGLILFLLGLLWPHVDLPHAWGVTAVVLIAHAAYANWVGVTTRRILGCGPQTRADCGGRSRGHRGKGKRRQLPAGVAVGGDRRWHRHRHRRDLRMNCLRETPL
jgi:hypothetical protein